LTSPWTSTRSSAASWSEGRQRTATSHPWAPAPGSHTSDSEDGSGRKKRKNGYTFLFIPEVIGKEIEKDTSRVFPLQNVFIRKVKILKAPKVDMGNFMEIVSSPVLPQFVFSRYMHYCLSCHYELHSSIDATCSV
jgi:hypothetical protein